MCQIERGNCAGVGVYNNKSFAKRTVDGAVLEIVDYCECLRSEFEDISSEILGGDCCWRSCDSSLEAPLNETGGWGKDRIWIGTSTRSEPRPSRAE
jgi:hypothetical protein